MFRLGRPDLGTDSEPKPPAQNHANGGARLSFVSDLDEKLRARCFELIAVAQRMAPDLKEREIEHKIYFVSRPSRLYRFWMDVVAAADDRFGLDDDVDGGGIDVVTFVIAASADAGG